MEWHHDYTCKEYDRFLADPHFRSDAQIKNSKIDALESTSQDIQRQIRIADEDWRGFKRLRCGEWRGQGLRGSASRTRHGSRGTRKHGKLERKPSARQLVSRKLGRAK